jgi:Cu(I)/Ag(I) efflux system membrane protein CusA/SilA
VTVYDRSSLIERAVTHLWEKLFEEFLVVAGVCGIFLFHLRSSLIAIICLPLAILAAFVIMRWQGLNANIMSLGGIAIAIGAMVDGAIVMIENMHKHMERTPLTSANRWQIVIQSASEVGPALFFTLLIITISFLPVFALEAQEGRLFAPLAFTKTYAMAASALLAITLVPVLMGYFIRGKVLPEGRNPINRVLSTLYQPLLAAVIRYPRSTLLLAFAITLGAVWPLSRIGTEFMPPLDEGDLMYMPTTYPGLSAAKARELLQQTDKLIGTVPEVASVFGKVGRAETATDPAPLTMIETFIQLKPRDQWRDGVTIEDLTAELDALIQFPGLTNAWVMPIKTRIDMLATGIKTPVGIKIAGDDLAQIDAIGRRLEQLLTEIPGTASVYSERVTGGRYIKIDIQRDKAARFNLAIADIQSTVASGVGGANLTQTLEGRERYEVNLRFREDDRDSPEQIALLPIITPSGQQITLADVARISVEEGPPAIKSENARLNGWIYIDLEGVDVGNYVSAAQAMVAQGLALPVGYSLTWSGQYAYMERAKTKLQYVVPLTVLLIALLLYLSFRQLMEVALIMATLPLAMVGSVWLIYALDFYFSVAVAVGFIALAGVTIEIGVIMLLYLNQSWEQATAELPDGTPMTENTLRQAILSGAGLRIRPVMMTTASLVVGLLPIMLSEGAGGDVMTRIAAPMIGGMISAVILTLLVLPAAFFLWKRTSLGGERQAEA